MNFKRLLSKDIAKYVWKVSLAILTMGAGVTEIYLGVKEYDEAVKYRESLK